MGRLITMELPLFPLHSVLCPGVALPLHIFEERYRLMIGRCIERAEPFGVVLIRDGREVGPLEGRLAEVGTTAVIRQAGRYPDGRLDIVTVGDRRFQIEALDDGREPYLVGNVKLLDEPVGQADQASTLGDRVGRRFLRYLELLQPALATDDGPEIEIEVEVEAPDDVVGEADEEDSEGVPTLILEAGADALHTVDTAALDDDQRRELLMAAARRLIATDDPTALSYLIIGLMQVELGARQALLETADTVTRLHGLDGLLTREIQLLSRHLKPLALDARLNVLRRN